ncbi:General secretion pathway protein F [Desulfonema limicola]|uniref:General secretion pathway protein F n=1 Tax=Desulfonema limicola TaxID=45656 RepID=A0A975B7A6_9BACT|nr:type II secretion system inner membrane protein GspF [Desulfonema limicola]QTA80151.1 General secretion pathway protein F [Desulfonema limicola]
MTVYSYKAADTSGRIIKGTLDAESETRAAGRIQEMGYIPIRIHQTDRGKINGDTDLLRTVRSFFIRISTKDVMLFTQDLSALLGAGLPIDRSLGILIDTIENHKFKDIIKDVLKAVQSGTYLSDAISRHPEAFSKFYTNMVKAGEAGGVLEAVLDRLGIFLETSQELKDYIKSALVYPIFLVCVGGISIIILMLFVIPKFSIIFADMGQTIPLSTQILIGLSKGLKTWWWLIILLFLSIYSAYQQYVKTPSGRNRADQLKLKLPLIGELIKKIETARFARTLGTLIKSGVPILQAINLVKDIISNTVIAKAMGKIYDRVKEGDRLSKPVEQAGIFPSLAVQMIIVGEESGRLDEMLLRVADNYEKIIRNMVKRLISLLEPAMILGMGLIVGFVVISMLMAIFSVNDIPF